MLVIAGFSWQFEPAKTQPIRQHILAGCEVDMIFDHIMAELSYDVTATDNSGYGMTEVHQKDVTYDNRVHSFAALVYIATKRDYKKSICYEFLGELNSLKGLRYPLKERKAVYI